jgi:large subunit ribosomal protein L37Ae
MAQTKATIPRHTSRFGARYGVSVKKRYEGIEVKQRVKHTCPKCGFQKVQRVSTGIYACKKCRLTYAGGAYYPQTLTGGIISKMVAQRTFNPQLIEVLADKTSDEKIPEVHTELTDEERIEQLTQGKGNPRSRKKKTKSRESEEEVAESVTLQAESQDPQEAA